MKRLRLYSSFLVVGLACLVAVPLVVAADDVAAPAVAAPPLAYGVSEIIQLSQAQVGDPTIVTFIKNSGNSYGLDAAQVIYLQQQGVSQAVISAMLTQPAPGSQPPAIASAPAVPSPQVTVIQEVPPTVVVPASSVYVIPDSQTCRYYNTYRGGSGYAAYGPTVVYFGSRNYRGGGHRSWYY